MRESEQSAPAYKTLAAELREHIVAALPPLTEGA